MDYEKSINELIADLDNMQKMLHQRWIETDPKSRTADVINGQGISASLIKQLVERKFKIKGVE